MDSQRRIGGVGMLWAVLAALLLGGSTLGAASIGPAIQKLNARGRNLKGDACIQYAGEYLKFVNDAAVAPAEKAYALQECMIYLMRVYRDQQLEQVLPKAREVFDLYRGDIVGSDPKVEQTLVTYYIGNVLAEEVTLDHERLAESLAAVAAYEGLLNMDPQDPQSNFYRGALYRAAGDDERAAEYMEKYIAASASPEPYAFSTLTAVYQTLEQPDKMLAAMALNMKRWGRVPGNAGNNADTLQRLLATGAVDEAKVLEMLPSFAHDAAATRVIVTALGERDLQAGNAEAALAYAKLAYAVATLEEAPAAMEFVGRCFLMAVEKAPDRAEMFWEYQKYGPAGKDGKPGTEDDCEDVLAGFDYPLAPDVVSAGEERFSEMTPRTPIIYENLAELGIVCLALGKPDDALCLFKHAYDTATIAELQTNEGNSLVPRALKALDGCIAAANTRLLYQEHGPAGPDGKLGTPDDVADPLANRQLLPLPPEVQKALQEITQDKTQSAEAFRQRGLAWLALGEYEKGFDQMRSALVFAAPDQAQAAVEGIAAAIKAFDGNSLRASQYLLFQKHGAAGPDKKPGTADDLENPFPAVLKEIRKTEAATAGR